MQKPESDIQTQWRKLRTEGSSSALKWLFQEFYDDLFAYALKKTASADVAKDAIQNTFADLWHYREKLSDTTSVKAYLFHAVRNHCFKILKKQGTSVELEDASPQMIFQPEELNLYDPLPYQKQRLTEILNSLSPRQREILYLKFYDNLDYQEIAQVLEINYQTTINHAHEAIVRLRKFEGLKELLQKF